MVPVCMHSFMHIYMYVLIHESVDRAASLVASVLANGEALGHEVNKVLSFFILATFTDGIFKGDTSTHAQGTDPMCRYILIYEAVELAASLVASVLANGEALGYEVNKVISLFNVSSVHMYIYVHRRFIFKGDTSTHARGTDPRVALGAEGELP